MPSHTILPVTAVLLAALSCALAACGDEGVDAANAAPTTSSVGGTGDVLPPVDAEVAASVTIALDGTPLGDWVDALTAHGVRDDPCSPDPPPLDGTLFEAAVMLADEVLAELLINADASYTAARAACEEGDPATAGAELAAANETTHLVADRLFQLGGSL